MIFMQQNRTVKISSIQTATINGVKSKAFTAWKLTGTKWESLGKFNSPACIPDSSLIHWVD